MGKKPRLYDVLIAGGGAAGLSAAITAAQSGLRVLVLEHGAAPAQKILSTGNGRCNFTNRRQGHSCYKSSDPAFVIPSFALDYRKTLDFFRDTLKVCVKEKEGYYYPRNESAAVVRNALLRTAKEARVRIQTDTGVRSITKNGAVFTADTKQGIYRGRTCILACGGRAFPKSGSDGSGYLYAKGFGHTVIDPLPALVPLIADTKQALRLSAAAGVRTDAKVTLLIDGQREASDTGQLQLTDYGLSGIPVFQISGRAARALHAGHRVDVSIDFLPEIECRELSSYLEANGCSRAALEGLLHPKLCSCLTDAAGQKADQLASYMKNTTVRITGTKPFTQAQTTSGGIPMREIDCDSMESHRVKGLYFAGEMLDVDGICGGYNLQWAFASGMRAAESAMNSLQGVSRLQEETDAALKEAYIKADNV